MPPLPDQGTVELARMSYTAEVSTTHPSALAMTRKDGNAVDVILVVPNLVGITLVVTIQEGDDLSSWTPIGLAQAIGAIGHALVTRTGLTKTYVRMLLEAAGAQGLAASVQVTVALRRS